MTNNDGNLRRSEGGVYARDGSICGSSLQKSLADAAAAVGIQTVSIGISFDIAQGGDEIKQVMKQLKGYRYRHVHCIIFDPQLNVIAEESENFGLVGPDCFCTFHGPDAVDMQGNAQFSPAVAKFLQGAGIVQLMGGLGGYQDLLESVSLLRDYWIMDPVQLPYFTHSCTPEIYNSFSGRGV